MLLYKRVSLIPNPTDIIYAFATVAHSVIVFAVVVIRHYLPVHAETAATVRANVLVAGSGFAEPLVASKAAGLAENKALLSALTVL
jgi:hypothetical protein